MPKKQTHQTAAEVYRLEISEHETGGFGILVDGKPMLLPRRDVFHTPSRTYAEFVLKTLSEGGPEHFDGSQCLLCHACTLFIDFSTGFVAPDDKHFRKFQKNIAWCSTYDPIHALCAGPEVVDQLARLGPFHEFCADRGITAPNWGQTFDFGDAKKESLEEVLRAKGNGDIYPAALSYFRCIEHSSPSLGQRTLHTQAIRRRLPRHTLRHPRSLRRHLKKGLQPRAEKTHPRCRAGFAFS